MGVGLCPGRGRVSVTATRPRMVMSGAVRILLESILVFI